MSASKSSVFLILSLTLFVFSCAGTKEVGGGLWNELGGQRGVSMLVHSFGDQLAKNSAASRGLGRSGIEDAKMGLYNSIAETGGYGIEKGSDLESVLKRQNLGQDAVAGVAQSLTAAGNEKGLRPDQLASLTGMWKPLGKSLAGR